MFCFETAFKLLTLSWAAYEDEGPPAGCETLCTLQKLNGVATSAGHTSEAGVMVDGECRCSHRLSSLKEVCIDGSPDHNSRNFHHQRSPHVSSARSCQDAVCLRMARI